MYDVRLTCEFAELRDTVSVCVRVLRAATGREVRAPVDGVRVRLAMRGHAPGAHSESLSVVAGLSPCVTSLHSRVLHTYKVTPPRWGRAVPVAP